MVWEIVMIDPNAINLQIKNETYYPMIKLVLN